VGVAGNLSRMALVGVAASALLLSGCGRKGPLELPPSAAARPAPQPTEPDQSSLGEPEHSALEGERTADLPDAPPARKSFFLDFLLK
jgi:predicted small lipoprotein YifL